jgi:short-subunit dehydrogenase
MTALNGAGVALTGAANGIGLALALALAERGADLALADVEREALEAVAREIRARHNVQVTTHIVDVADRTALQKYADEATRAHPKLNVLINNAGVGLMGRFDEVTAEEYDWLIRINFGGVVDGTRAFLPHLKRQSAAHIVNLSSVFGLVAPPGQTAYAAAKFAVRGFTESLRHEFEGTNVHVTSVHPGGIATGIAARARKAALVDDQRKQDAVARFATVAKSTPEFAAKTIIAGIEANAPRILIGKDARRIAMLARLRPVHYWKSMQGMVGGPPPPKIK